MAQSRPCGCSARKHVDRRLANIHKYNEEGLERVEKAAREAGQKRTPSPAKRKWDLLVAGIMGRDGVTRAVAMQRARKKVTYRCANRWFGRASGT